MKFLSSLLIVVLCVAYSTARLSGEQRKLLKRYGSDCAALIKIDEDAMNRLSNGDLEDSTFNEMCWLECLFERMGVLKDGAIQTSVVMASLESSGFDMDTATEITFNCSNPEGENACQRAHSLARCYLKNNAGLHHKKRK